MGRFRTQLSGQSAACSCLAETLYLVPMVTFKKAALCGSDSKNNVNEQPGSASVVQATSSAITIGYSGVVIKYLGQSLFLSRDKAKIMFIQAKVI